MANIISTPSPFLFETDRPLVAVLGPRNGYVQLATAAQITQYGQLPDGLFMAAKDWAARLEALGAQRVYWITLSEVVTHLHIHLYPRWDDDEPRGVALFEGRHQLPQPQWTAEVKANLKRWSDVHSVDFAP